MPSPFARRITAALLLPWALQFPSQAATEALSDALAKAVFLFNLSKYGEWPENAAQGELVICVEGDDEVAKHLASQQGKAVGERRLAVLRNPPASGLAQCHVLFLGSAGSPPAAAKLPVLSVSDRPDFLDEGGMVQISLEEQRVAFAVDLTAVRETGMNLSAHLLRLAKQVRYQQP